jgi:hypothetical protein
MRRARGTGSADSRGDLGWVPARVRRVTNQQFTLNGTSPAISLVGTIYVPLTVALRMTLGGVLGVALLQVSVNGGAYGLPQLALANVSLPGQPDDAQLMLAAGLYSAGDTYSISVAP